MILMHDIQSNLVEKKEFINEYTMRRFSTDEITKFEFIQVGP